MNLLETAVIDPYLDRILVVDDEPMIRDPLAEYLACQGFSCDTAGTGQEALRKLERQPFALVIADIRMPELNGLQLLDNLNQKYPDTAVMMITAVADVQTAVQTMKQGATDYITKPFDLDQVVGCVKRALHLRLLRLEDKKISENLETLVREKSFALHSALRDLNETCEMTLEALTRALDARGHETQCHSQRVQAYTVRLGQDFGYKNGEMTELARGALLHDIGKIGVGDAILNKPGKLTPDEWVEMKRHPVIGYQILQGVEFLDSVAQMVLSHHEHYDGSGYPSGLQGEEIPLEARLFAVLDAYDAMTSDRPYRKAMPSEHARGEIATKAGSQFDPIVVGEFMKIPQDELDQISQKYCD